MMVSPNWSGYVDQLLVDPDQWLVFGFGLAILMKCEIAAGVCYQPGECGAS